MNWIGEETTRPDINPLEKMVKEKEEQVSMLEQELDEVKQKLDIFSIREEGGLYYLRVRTKVGPKEVQIT